jgi:dipeptidyl aminopeptidase/acylaminoacyl peptidase
MIAFDWSGPDDPETAIYIQRIDDTSPVRLTPGIHADFWPVWSPDGKQIAFLRETAPYQAEAVVIPVVGIGERVLFEIVKASGERPRLDWSADGRLFATAERKRTRGLKPDFASSILLFSPATGERRTLTHPAEDWHGDSEPVFSPDSKIVAFRRTRPASGDEDIFEAPVAGGDPRGITADRAGVAALVYTPDRRAEEPLVDAARRSYAHSDFGPCLRSWFAGCFARRTSSGLCESSA